MNAELRQLLERSLETHGSCGAYFDALAAAEAHKDLRNPIPSPIARACAARVEEIAEALGVGNDD